MKEDFNYYHDMINNASDMHDGKIMIDTRVLKFIMEYIKPYGDHEDRLTDKMYEIIEFHEKQMH